MIRRAAWLIESACVLAVLVLAVVLSPVLMIVHLWQARRETIDHERKHRLQRREYYDHP